ncbi:MAG: glycosyltransferase family 2 protein [Planctomycetota bacterium]
MPANDSPSTNFVDTANATKDSGHGQRSSSRSAQSAASRHAANVQRYRSPMMPHDDSGRPHVDLSFVIPAMNEDETLQTLVEQIAANVPNDLRHEVILIDDGSTDQTWDVMMALADIHAGVVTAIKFRGNRGKAHALNIGFDAAIGDVIFTMDADLQDDPREIPRFLNQLEAGYDLVSGWKQVRHDPWHKVWPSRVFNRMLSRVSRVRLHDHNCGFKAYRRRVAKSLQLFGELHRMVPALSGMQGYRVTEIPVTHHPRRHGVSKYGIERFIRGFSDMMTMGFLRKFRHRPLHLASAVAVLQGLGSATFVCSAFLIGISNPLGMMLIIASALILCFASITVLMGMYAELMIRVPYDRDHDDGVESVV